MLLDRNECFGFAKLFLEAKHFKTAIINVTVDLCCVVDAHWKLRQSHCCKSKHFPCFEYVSIRERRVDLHSKSAVFVIERRTRNVFAISTRLWHMNHTMCTWWMYSALSSHVRTKSTKTPNNNCRSLSGFYSLAVAKDFLIFFAATFFTMLRFLFECLRYFVFVAFCMQCCCSHWIHSPMVNICPSQRILTCVLLCDFISNRFAF